MSDRLPPLPFPQKLNPQETSMSERLPPLAFPQKPNPQNEVSVLKEENDCLKKERRRIQGRTPNIDPLSTNQGGEFYMKETKKSSVPVPQNMLDDDPLSIVNFIPSTKDPSAYKMIEFDGKDTLVKEAQISTVEFPLNISDDEPLSVWFEAVKTAHATKGRNVEKKCITNFSQDFVIRSSQRIDPPKTTDVICILHGKEANEKCTTNCSQDIVSPSSQCNDHTLPFAKSSPLWKNFESMQVFLRWPQNPHFRTLVSKKESSREGLAIALMVDFANAVEKTCNLQPDDPKNIIEDLIETLRELEDNGFDVNIVRDRVVKWLLLKNKREELVAKAKEIKVQYNIEKQKVEELDNHIRSLREKLDLALATKARKDSIFSRVKSEGQ